MIVLNRERTTRRRGGFSIIELLVLMTAVAVMLGLSVLMLQLLMRLEGDSRARLEASATLDRLARQFRRDVHAARLARAEPLPSAKNDGLLLESAPGHVIAYRPRGNGAVERVVSEAGKVIQRESYSVPRGGPIRLGLTDEEGRRFASLGLNRPVSKNQSDPPRYYEIIAKVGKNVNKVEKSQSIKAEGDKS